MFTPGDLVWTYCSSVLWEKPLVNSPKVVDSEMVSSVTAGEMLIVVDTIPSHTEIKVVNCAGRIGWISKDILTR